MKLFLVMCSAVAFLGPANGFADTAARLRRGALATKWRPSPSQTKFEPVPWTSSDALAGDSRSSVSTALSSSSSSADESAPRFFDWDALAKYAIAIGVQVGLFAAVFSGLDLLVEGFAVKVPLAVDFVFFYFCALRSRILNPLANTRPNQKSLEAMTDQPKRRMPSFTPPGFVFPIVWLLIIGPLRAGAASLVHHAVGRYTCAPLLALALHLSIGDVWNTVNNVERRYGASVTGVLCVWLSKAYAAYCCLPVAPLASRLLAVTLVWLTIATTLVTATWRLNPDPVTGKVAPLYPVTGGVRTRFAWFRAA